LALDRPRRAAGSRNRPQAENCPESWKHAVVAAHRVMCATAGVICVRVVMALALSERDRERLSLFVDEMRAMRAERGWSRAELAAQAQYSESAQVRSADCGSRYVPCRFLSRSARTRSLKPRQLRCATSSIR